MNRPEPEMDGTVCFYQVFRWMCGSICMQPLLIVVFSS